MVLSDISSQTKQRSIYSAASADQLIVPNNRSVTLCDQSIVKPDQTSVAIVLRDLSMVVRLLRKYKLDPARGAVSSPCNFYYY